MLKSDLLSNDPSTLKVQIFDLLVALSDQERSARAAGRDVQADVCFDAKLRVTDALGQIAGHPKTPEHVAQIDAGKDAASVALGLLSEINDGPAP